MKKFSIFKLNKDLDKDEERVEKNWWKIAFIVVIGAALLGSILGMIVHYTVSDSTVAATQIDSKVKGNKRSGIYHIPGCKSYDSISPNNIEWFRTETDAVAAGYRKALNCN